MAEPKWAQGMARSEIVSLVNSMEKQIAKYVRELDAYGYGEWKTSDKHDGTGRSDYQDVNSVLKEIGDEIEQGKWRDEGVD